MAGDSRGKSEYRLPRFVTLLADVIDGPMFVLMGQGELSADVDRALLVEQEVAKR